MKLTKLPIEFTEATPIIKKIQKGGYEAYFVGGSVRDVLLNKPIHDVDIASSAYPEEIKQLFRRTIDVGIEHGTVLVLHGSKQYEITTFRTESTYQDFRRPDTVTFVRSLSEDLKRRDFTINALALDRSGQVIDQFDGISDIENKVIRAVGDPKARFHEDALRMMRALRFASQLDFQIEEKTLAGISAFHFLLEKVSVERITIEFVKMLLGKNRKAGLYPFIQTECYQYCPCLKQAGEALLNFSELPNQQIAEESEAWTLLLHSLDLTKEAALVFLKSWKLSNHLIQEVCQLSKGLNFRLKKAFSIEMLYELGLEKALIVEKLLIYYHKESQPELVKQQFAQLPIHNRKQLAITGKDLLNISNGKSGKWVGELLSLIESQVLHGDLINTTEELISYAKSKLEMEDKKGDFF
ncbi:CCA tRNA nucleotidyltransferase [Melissococcus plutonius]|uniref:CCA tRNA nucleotidyltransferase n=1 Tax=Melissococcus plutonius TaxID=33970 RepID=UPI003C2D28AF